MCISIPGQIIEFIDAEKQMGRVKVADHAGSIRTIYLGLLATEEAAIGKWLLMNAGMAVRSLEADEVAQILQVLDELDRQSKEEHL